MLRESSTQEAPNSIIENQMEKNSNPPVDFLSANRKFLNKQEDLD
mgnify:CR=1 FL=1